MDSTITLNQILNLPNEVIDLSKQYGDQGRILSLKYCSLYYDVYMVKNVRKMFDRFNDIKYFCRFSIEDAIKITPTYELKDGTRQRSNISQQENIVTKEIDSMIWATKFYDSILVASKKLSLEESIYLSDSFLKNVTEENIAQKIGVHEDTLKNHIKKSCIIKVWTEVRTLYEDNY